jgi:DnaK suppressor protein
VGVRVSEAELLTIDINSIKKSLLNQKAEYLNKSFEFKSEQANSFISADESDATSLDIINSTSILLLEKERKTLFAIERALSKIADGTYGCCEECSEQITIGRLQARPFTVLCIDCQAEQELLGSALQ